MRAVDIIMKKRSGQELARDEIAFVIGGYVAGEIPEYQISALLMAIYFKGMTARETADLTELMLRSGEVMDLSGLSGPFVDKHSTGGVGDKVSLILAPLAASCGAKVPMMSGRALGHTGGTLDKLESIPGYLTGLSQASFRAGIKADGFAMTGQTAKVVPADKKLYALRDVTGTVESIPLITASILSKKVAEGAQSLVFDVKTGSGAFMKSLDEARSLTRSLVDTGSSLGKRIVGVMTDMSQPLGNMVGNFFEVEESLECLEGNGPADLMELSYRLTAWMLVASGLRPDLDAALESCREGIASGKALGLFLDNVKRQGGDVGGMMDLRGRHRSAFSLGIAAASEGYIHSIDAFAIGLAGISLGVGRNTTSDPVYPDVGFIFDKKAGDRVKRGQKILTMYGKDESSLSAVREDVERSIRIGLDPPPRRPLILEEMQSS
jgi:pyrimidine-nucleoside phosphorylase